MVIETECSADSPYNLIEALKESMSTKLGPPAKSPSTVRRCIFKAPQVLRRHKPEAYEPYVVSIGPIHRDCEQVQRMKTVKQGYLRTLLSRMDISLEKFIDDFNDFLLHEPEGKNIIQFGKEARDFYEEPLDDLNDREFTEVMILDGCFVIQLARKNSDPVNARDDGDPNMDYMFQYVCHDLLLLENQLPFFVLSRLYDLIRNKLPREEHVPKFSVVLLRAFSKLKSLEQYLKPYRRAGGHKDNDDKLCHILDLIRTSIVCGFKPNTEETNKSEPGSDKDAKLCHIIDLRRTSIVCGFIPNTEETNKNEPGSDIPPATALSEAGVEFKRDDSADNLLNIKFKKGVLTIPELTIGELTEPLFRNLIAFEQCYPDHPHEITSYAAFMDKLISSDKDVKLLSKEKILDNWLSVEDGSELFNKLYIDTFVKGFRYEKLCAEVNEYYKVEWHKHMARFWRDYCSTPWKVIALIAGILILVSTLLQTIFTILGYKGP